MAVVLAREQWLGKRGELVGSRDKGRGNNEQMTENLLVVGGLAALAVVSMLGLISGLPARLAEALAVLLPALNFSLSLARVPSLISPPETSLP